MQISWAGLSGIAVHPKYCQVAVMADFEHSANTELSFEKWCVAIYASHGTRPMKASPIHCTKPKKIARQTIDDIE
jgi:hypothetical protein